jgi:aryl-alcohol dehydrogenase-like predicted oxidoreductase
MKYSRLGRSNLKVSRVCLGTMHFGRVTPEDEAFRIMDRALEMGLNFFDTANVYGGNGLTETIIGRWFAQGGGRREKTVLATKVYGQMGDGKWPNEEGGISAYKIRRQAADSLRRLQTDHIDLYQVHHIDRTITGEEFWGTFERLIADGDVLYVGTSNFPGWGLAKYQSIALTRGLLGIVSEQSMYNLLCRYPELEVLPAALEFGIGVIPYMPLAGGLLTGKKRSVAGSRTAQVEGEYGIPVSDNARLEAFSKLCAELGEKESAVAIAWTLAHPAVTSPIVGVRTVGHLDGLDRAAELELGPEVLKRLDEIFPLNEGRPLRTAVAPEAYAW